MTAQPETFEFQTETRHLLDLMIHSVYSHKEIFLRELVSNASDALDKLRFEALQRPDWAGFTTDPHIRLSADPAGRTLTISDNGIGMSRAEIIEYIGTIARSGTREFLKAAEAAKSQELSPELIGQFGVGFYSSFMVADRVSLLTRRAGEAGAWRWESAGDGQYTLEETERPEPGTTVTLHLKPADEEDGLEDFAKEWVVRKTVKKYSDFVSYPIRMRVERQEPERDAEGKPVEGAPEKTVVTDETLNSMQAIWTRPEAEVTAEEYREFYRHISHDWAEPLTQVTFKAEGRTEFRSLLFLPSKAPFDLFLRDGSTHGIHLYIRRVFIMQDCKELIPEYLRFVRGVVDSEDLSLNISREILQQNRQIQQIRAGVVRKVLDTLASLRKNEGEKFATFWKEFGRVVKEGLFQDAKNRDKILDFCLFPSTRSATDLVSLEDYIGRMAPGQDTVYYLNGESRALIENSPHLEAFRAKGIEVLLLSDPVDEVWVQSVHEYKEKKFQSVGKGEVELGTEDEKKQAEEERKEKSKNFAPLFASLQKALDAQVKEVRLSARLTASPVCLVGDEADLSPQLEQMLRAAGQEIPPSKRILELNPDHPLLGKLNALHAASPESPELADYADLLFGQALLAEGGQLPDAARFNQHLAALMLKAL